MRSGCWTQKWGMTKEQLAAAVNKAGVGADAVARELGKRNSFGPEWPQERL